MPPQPVFEVQRPLKPKTKPRGPSPLELRRRRRRIQAGLGALGLVAAAFGVVKGSDWMILKASRTGQDCIDAESEAATGNYGRCFDAASRWLTLAGRLPWSRAQALELDKGLRLRAAQEELTLATAQHPDRKRLAEAAAHLFAVEGPGVSPFDALGWAGAVHEIAQAHARAAGVRDHLVVFNAALMVGDDEALAAVAQRSGEDPLAALLDVKRGAWLCLTGDSKEKKELGAAALRTATARAPEQAPNSPWLRAQSALAACGGDGASDKRATANATASETVALFSALAERDESKRRSFVAKTLNEIGGIEGRRRIPLVALAIHDVEPSLREAAALVLPPSGKALETEVEEFLYFGHATMIPRYMGDAPIPIAPERAEAAAGRLEAVIARAARSPAESRAVIEELYRFSMEENKQKAAQTLLASLRRAAVSMWLEAGGAWLRRGDRARAKAAAERAAAAADEPLWRGAAASLLVTMGEVEGGLAILDKALGTPDLEAQQAKAAFFLHLSRAVALARLGRYEEAHSASARASDAPGKQGERARRIAGWTRAALSLRVGKGARAEGAGELGEMGYWAEMVGKPDAEKRSLRRRFKEDLKRKGLVPTAALVPMMFVLGRMTGEGDDVEVWLDEAFAAPLAERDLLPLAWARAEAARWRGDEAAAKAWDERFARLQARIRDERGEALAAVVGL